MELGEGGETVTKRLTASSIRDKVRIVPLGEDKDPSGLHLKNPEHFPRSWQDALQAAVPLDQLAK